MTPYTNRMLRYYSSTPEEKLARARLIAADAQARPAVLARLEPPLERLRLLSLALEAHMQAMDLGRLCSRCAARSDGGCCSALMADNSDSLQIAINLLLGVAVEARQASVDECCFLGDQGCGFLIKPIFCLNYNCSHILAGAEPAALELLYQRAGAVLSSQVGIESLLLEFLRHQGREEAL